MLVILRCMTSRGLWQIQPRRLNRFGGQGEDEGTMVDENGDEREGIEIFQVEMQREGVRGPGVV
jgi:hypothetical protein